MLRHATLIAMIAAAPAVAADFVVTTSTTTQNDGNVIDGNDSITVNQGVTVDTRAPANTDAISGSGALNTVTNNGTLLIDGAAAGVRMTGNATIVTNTGTITATGASGQGMFLSGAGNEVTNSGTITSSGLNGHVLRFSSTSNTFTNTGTVRATGSNAHALVFNDAEAIVTNSGLIESVEGDAVRFESNSNTITLNAPGFVAGGLRLGAISGVVLNGGASQSDFYTFTGTPWNTVSTTGDLPIVVNAATQQIGTIDPTQFAAFHDGLGQIGQAIDDALPVTTAPSVQVTQGTPDASGGVSIHAFGAATQAASKGALLARDVWTTGALIRFAAGDGFTAPGWVAGVGQGNYSANATFMASQRIDTATAFAGPYARFALGATQAQLSLVAGIQQHSSRRFINNNAVAGGIETASGAYGSTFLRPAARIARQFSLGAATTLGLTADASYTFVRTGAYTETGATGAASFNASSGARVQAGLGLSLTRDMGRVRIAGLAGSRYRALSGGAITGTLAAQGFTYDPAGTVNGTTSYAGVEISTETAGGTRARLSAFREVGSGGVTGWRANADLTVRF